MRIIVTGLIAQHYTLAGVSWDYFQYFLGLKNLGYDVYYLEDSGEWPYNPEGGTTKEEKLAKDCTKNVSHLTKLFARYGASDRWAYFFPLTSEWFGLSDLKRKTILQTADILINVSGTLDKPELYTSVKKLIYIDSDPGFTQVKLKLKHTEFTRLVRAHDAHFSFGETLPDVLTDTEFNWIPTRTPIVLSEWTTDQPFQNGYTTIMNWTSYEPLIYRGMRFTQKDTEFIKFLTLKSYFKNIPFEVALSKLQHKYWQEDLQFLTSTNEVENISYRTPADLLSHHGWNIVDPAEKCGDIDAYRNYIFYSKGEWSVAKGGYVTTKSGWFSCRSACYLAAGRPVVVQDTGFSQVLPVGEGVLTFNTIDEAVAAINDIEARYPLHARRAREIATTYFDSDKVLKDLLEKSFAA